MNLFKRNTVPGKTKIYKTVEKYRKPGQIYKAPATVVVLPDTEKTGMVGVIVNSFDGIPWLFIARLKDMYELHQENKLSVVNMNINKNEILIKGLGPSGMEFTFFKKAIKNPNINIIHESYVQNAMQYLERTQG